MPEDGADPLWLLGEAAHVSDRRPLQLLLAARRRPAGDRLLEVGVHALVRVQFRAVRGQVEHLDLGPVRGQPSRVRRARCALGRSTIRNTLRRASRIRRRRKRMNLKALTAPSTTIQRNSPLLVTAEIRLSLARRWQTRTTGVRPRGA